MIRTEEEYVYPDDDGRIKRPWIKNSVERGSSACERVKEVLSERPWVNGELLETVKNSTEDGRGVDLYVPMRRNLLRKLGIVQTEKGVTFQIKSGDHAIRKFLSRRKIFKEGTYAFKEGRYSFVLNGQNAKDVILADMVGQMAALAGRFDTSEAEFLEFLATDLGDGEAVLRYSENREIVLEHAWYKYFLK